MRIYLIRHSMTKGNKEKRYIGTTDESLCLEGIQLLEERKGMYPEVTYVYVSPMKRCVQTAEIIYPEMMKAGAYSCNEKLRECDFGLFENHNYIELSGCPEYQAWIDSGGKLPFPEGESREAFIRRTLEGFREVVRDAQAHDRETIAVVAHGGTIMSIMERYAVKEDGTPAGSYYDYQIKNGEGYELRISENDIYDDRDRGGLCSGSDFRGSKMAVSSGEADRASDIGNRKNIRNCLPANKTGKRIGGGILVLVVVTVSTGVPAVILSVAYKYFWQLGLALESFWCYQILATKSLKVESDRVYIALKDKGLEAGRKAVSMIVGRDTQNLTEEGVTKAAVETVAENTSDGVIAPLFYMLIGGAVLGFAYKAINTMDSMVGYKNDRYQWFGTAAAKLDDVVNFIPARVSAVLMIVASYLTGMDGKNAARIFRRDRFNHKSPNSAQTEAVMAGALDVQLAGDAWYFGKLHKKPTIGDPVREMELLDIRRSHKLLYGTAMLGLILGIILRILVL